MLCEWAGLKGAGLGEKGAGLRGEEVQGSGRGLNMEINIKGVGFSKEGLELSKWAWSGGKGAWPKVGGVGRCGRGLDMQIKGERGGV